MRAKSRWGWLTRFVCAAFIAVLSPNVPVFADTPQRDGERDRRLLETYMQMLEGEPAQDYAFRRLLETAHAVGGLSGLIAVYRDEVGLRPKSYAAWLVLGNLYRTAEDTAEAIKCFERAVEIEPRAADPHLFIAAIHRRKRAFPEAFAAYDRAIERLREREAKQSALRDAAETAVEAKDLLRARHYFEKIVQTEPNNRFLRMQEASTLSRLGESTLALEVWKDIEGRTGELGELLVVWKEIAAIELELEHYEAAEATWRKGLSKLPVGHYERRVFLEGLVSVKRRSDTLRTLIPELSGLGERDFDALVTLARIHEELAEDESALLRYREAEKRRPTDEAVRMTVLTLLERMGRTDEVFEAWGALLKTFPNEPRYALKLAELYFQRSRTKEAHELMRRTSKGHPYDPGVHAALVELWLRFGDKTTRAEIEWEYKNLMKLEPDERMHVISLGEYYWSIEDKPRALETWGRLKKMGAHGEGSFAFGEVLFDHDLVEQARENFEAALAQAPEEPKTLRALALLHEKVGRVADALALWQRILDLPAGRSGAATREAREHLIELWEKLKRTKSELASLEARFKGEPPDIAAGRLLAVALQKMGRTEETLEVLERLDEKLPDDFETLLGLEQAYTRRGAVTEAIGVLERLARLAPKAATEYLYRAADLALGARDTGQASRLARQILELAPQEASAYLRVGELYLRMNLRADAAESWRRALFLEPRNTAVRFRLASVYRELGEREREMQVLEGIVKDTSEPTEMTRVGKRLIELALSSGRVEALEEVARILGGGREGAGRAARSRLIIEVYARMVRMLRASRGEGVEKRLLELGESALKPLVIALEDADLAMRSEALEVVEATRPAGAVPALSRLALDPEAVGHLSAVMALGRIGTSGAVAVLSRLISGASATGRELGLWALGLSDSAEALRVLAERAAQGSPRERLLAALALGRGRHVGGEALALALALDKSLEVREVGLWALGRLKAVDGVFELEKKLSQAQTLREAQVVAWSLGEIGTDAARMVLVKNLFQGREFEASLWAALVRGEARDDGAVDAGYGAMLSRERGTIATSRPAFHLPPWGTMPTSAELARGAPLGEAIALRLQQIFLADKQEELVALGQALVSERRLSFMPVGLSTRDGEEAGRIEALTRFHLAPHRAAMLHALEKPQTRSAWLPVWQRLIGADEVPEGLVDAAWAEVELARHDEGLVAALGILAATPLNTLTGEQRKALEALSTSRDAEVRLAAAPINVALRDEDGVLRLLGDQDPVVVVAVCEALAASPWGLSPHAYEALVERAADPRPSISDAAKRALDASSLL